jgi:hypothetical protein
VSEPEIRDLLEAAGFSMTCIELHDVVRVAATPEEAIRFPEAALPEVSLATCPKRSVRQLSRQSKRRLEAMAIPEGIRQHHRLLAPAIGP